jgi:superfamily II DNA or RNA helicase
VSAVDLTESFFSKVAGWEAMKQARAIVAEDRVLSSDWSPPLLRGMVQAGDVSYRSGLAIRSERDIENLCTCRQSRQWGTICAHAVAVGLHYLKSRQADLPTSSKPRSPSEQTISSTSPVLDQSEPFLQRAGIGETGEPARLHLILPPNFGSASNQGRFMVYFEAEVKGKRVPLNALPKDEAYSFSEPDQRLLDFMQPFTDGRAPAMLTLSADQMASLLSLLTGHPRVTLGRATPVSVVEAPWSPPIRALLEPNGDLTLRLDQAQAKPFFVAGKWILRENVIQLFGLPERCRSIFDGPVRLSREEIPFFLSLDWPALEFSGGVQANFRLEDFILETGQPEWRLELKGGLAMLEARLKCVYGSKELLPASPDAAQEQVPGGTFIPDPSHPRRYWTRDGVGEQAAVGRLIRAGFAGPDREGAWHLNGREPVLNFFARDYPRMKRDWHVTLEERLQRSTERNLERIEPRFQVTSSGVAWFDLGVVFQASDGTPVSPAEMQRLLRSGRHHTPLKNGKIALINSEAVEELQEVLQDCAPQQREGRYRIQSVQAGFVQSTMAEHGWKPLAPGDWTRATEVQTRIQKPVCPPLNELESVLRPYQKDGVAWLDFLRAHQWGGILADEMGLGKTLQTLAFIEAKVRARTLKGSGDRESVLPSLVVCPTSLVSNWAAEAARFTPNLKVLAMQGPDRDRHFPTLSRYDLVVTSYALVRRDAERYRDTEFDTLILDEAQHIKNRQTQNAQAVKAVRARHRFVLTGTPLENSVLDLWSIFDFLMPGYLGSARDFRERYEAPISRDQDARAQARLVRRVRPFILRRLKGEVARDLPPKIEQVSFCELTEAQQAVYRQFLQASRKEILETAGSPAAWAKHRMLVLNALLRLRQVCCDLRLLKLEGVDPATASGKTDLFGELLEEALDGGHRVLVFSQFVAMLTLLRQKLDEEEIEYCYLDGSTPDRAAVVNRFQSRSAIPVFLISLKAGGVGLNLAGADTVIHFDPWWNPAVEAQATDRAHRIGQTRVVTSYKLITRGTVEEKILALQDRKKARIEATLGGEEDLARVLDWQDIQDLLAE